MNDNLIPGIHGKIFTINTKNDEDRAKVKEVLLEIPEIDNVKFNTAVNPNEMTVIPMKILAVSELQKMLIHHHFHALPKTFMEL